MASNDDDDLIDLGNDACVPRVTVDDPTPEEQEHLLDVCPPKLEQTLSLSRRQEHVSDTMDSKGDVLVTLGHDQVVPVRKRIDVVSSDTIKRIRDITRNLEPVIRRTRSAVNVEQTRRGRGDEEADRAAIMNGSLRCSSKHEDETSYEAQEINNAFNFLAEHEDSSTADEHEAETSFELSRNDNADCNRSVSSVHRLIEEADAIDGLIDVPSSSSEETTRQRDGSDVGEARRDRDTRKDAPRNRCTQLDNPAFESSPDHSRQFSPAGGSIDPEPRTTAVLLKRRSPEDVAQRECKRRSLQESHRKSSTAEPSLNSSALTDGLPGIDRSTSLEESHHCTPSTSDVGRGISSFLTRYDYFEQCFRPACEQIRVDHALSSTGEIAS